MNTKPDYGFWKLWNLSFGFFGVQIAYALQSAQVSRIFSTIGADPHDLSYFWILPPLMGLVVQPLVGSASDRTWNRFGRRLPYLLAGALVAIIVMCFLPNAGSLGLSVSSAILFGLIMLMFLDTSINMAMQPFKMLVGDFVNEKQKGLAYSIQSFLCNAGSLVGYLAPIVLAMFLSNTAPEGEVPGTVTWSFYLGAIILLLCVIYTFWKVREMPPAEYAAYHGIDLNAKSDGSKKENIFKLLVKAPKVFWTVGLVQFFCWGGFLYMWTYSTDAVANHSFNAPSVERITGITVDGVQYSDKYLFEGETPIIEDGRLTLAGVTVNGEMVKPDNVTVNGEKVIENGKIVYTEGMPKVSPDDGMIADKGETINIDGKDVTLTDAACTVSQLSQITPGATLTLAHIATIDKNTGKYALEQTSDVPTTEGSVIDLNTTPVLNAASKQYQDAGDWIGVLFAIQAIAAVIWAVVLPRFRNRRMGYSISLLIGAIGFISVYFFTNKYMLGVSYALVGCAWAAMLAMPFTILTNALNGDHIGTYLGLFNCTICVPQIIAALCGGLILGMFAPAANGAPNTVWMLVTAGVLLAIGAIAVWNIRETYGSQSK
jgi:MFS family permease